MFLNIFIQFFFCIFPVGEIHCSLNYGLLLPPSLRFKIQEALLLRTETCACAPLSSEMALREGSRRLKLLFRLRHLPQLSRFVSVRSVSENVSSKSSASETADDHLIYTPEHFALKEALRKVCRTADTQRC